MLRPPQIVTFFGSPRNDAIYDIRASHHTIEMAEIVVIHFLDPLQGRILVDYRMIA